MRQRFVPKKGAQTAVPPVSAGVLSAISVPCQSRRSPPPVESSDEETQVQEPELPIQGLSATESSKIIPGEFNGQSRKRPRPESQSRPQSQLQPRRQEALEQPLAKAALFKLAEPDPKKSPALHLFEWFRINRVNCVLRAAVELHDRHFEHLSFLASKGDDEEIAKMLETYAQYYNIGSVFE